MFIPASAFHDSSRHCSLSLTVCCGFGAGKGPVPFHTECSTYNISVGNALKWHTRLAGKDRVAPLRGASPQVWLIVCHLPEYRSKGIYKSIGHRGGTQCSGRALVPATHRQTN